MNPSAGLVVDADAATSHDERRWRAVQKRQVDASFVYAVTSTGIYCRSGCPARIPQRANVRFFATSGEARTAGFRACKRCHPDADVALSPLKAESIT